MDKQSKAVMKDQLPLLPSDAPVWDLIHLLLCFQILISSTVVLKRLWMHLLVQHPSLLMTEHGKEGDGGVVMHASYPKLLQIFKRKNTQKKQKFRQCYLLCTATRCLTGKQNQSPTSLIWHICPTTGAAMANQQGCKSTTDNWLQAVCW